MLPIARTLRRSTAIAGFALLAPAVALPVASAPAFAQTTTQPAPKHHSKLKGAIVGGAAGAVVGGKKGALVGAAGGALYQHHKNKVARRQAAGH